MCCLGDYQTRMHPPDAAGISSNIRALSRVYPRQCSCCRRLNDAISHPFGQVSSGDDCSLMMNNCQ